MKTWISGTDCPRRCFAETKLLIRPASNENNTCSQSKNSTAV